MSCIRNLRRFRQYGSKPPLQNEKSSWICIPGAFFVFRRVNRDRDSGGIGLFSVKRKSNLDICHLISKIRHVSEVSIDLIPVGEAAPVGAELFAEDEKRAMQRAVIALFQRWDLSDHEASQLLGGISVRTYQRWKQGTGNTPIGVDLASRMSNLLGIHKALRLLFSEKERGYGWIKRDNEAFGGRSALDVMMGGQLTDLMRVRRYLDSQRSPW